MHQALVLASASPRRRELLQQIGLDFQVVPSCVAEQVLPGETPEEHVIRLSLAKAEEVAGRKDVSGRWFIGSDTIVLCADNILGKPQNREDATCMLQQLSGKDHRVLSGFALLDVKTGEQWTEAVSTRVRFRRLTAAEIARYIATGEADDKAGAYAIQGLGVCFVAGIEGSYTNVVGLPLCRLTLAMQAFGIPLPV